MASTVMVVAPADGEGDDWRRKCENLGEELKTERENGGAQQAEIQRLEEQLRADSEKWQSLKTQLEEEAELQEEKLRSLQDELRETARQLQGARGALNDPINEVRKELYQKRGELEIKEKDNREMKYRLRERELEVEILERRLLEEDDTNRVWKYKYVGSL
ncbi:hypothetical protein FQN54_006490 [Arachnomyces sp. PD_36]|nr:hypothetical protein FQN54_006490 [Arachnomyces sp. PD_36]